MLRGAGCVSNKKAHEGEGSMDGEAGCSECYNPPGHFFKFNHILTNKPCRTNGWKFPLILVLLIVEFFTI